MRFEWDEDKACLNESKHGITFAKAADLLLGDCVIYRARVHGERRLKVLARSGGECFAIIVTIRNERVRIISARHATANERSSYDRDYNRRV